MLPPPLLAVAASMDGCPPPPRALLVSIGATTDVEPTCVNSKRDCDGRLRSAIWTVPKEASTESSSTESHRRLVIKHIISRHEFNVAFEKIRHRNIVTYHSHFQCEAGEHWIVMDHCEGRTLSKVIDDWKSQSAGEDEAAASLSLGGQREIVSIMTQLLEAVRHLHVMSGFLHRDLKPDNIIVGSNGHVTIIDLDLLKLTAQSHQVDTGMHTPGYTAPERLQDQPRCTTCSDMWSLGCILYELVALRPPFPNGEMSSYKPLRSAISERRQNMFDETWLYAISRLTMELLQNQPSDRPTVDAVLQQLNQQGASRLESTSESSADGDCTVEATGFDVPPQCEGDHFSLFALQKDAHLSQPSGMCNVGVDDFSNPPGLHRDVYCPSHLSTGGRSNRTHWRGDAVIGVRQRLAAAYQSAFRYMELSVTPDDAVEPLEFEDVFVLVHLEQGRTGPGGYSGVPRKDIKAKQVPRMAADLNQRLVLIEADAGWGKSTMLRDLARTQDDRDACGFLIVHADLRTVLEMPSVTAAGSQSQLYNKAAEGAVRTWSEYVTASQLNEDDETRLCPLFPYLISRDRAEPVVWLFDALDEVSANDKWNDAVQSIRTHKVTDHDIVIFTARPHRSDRVRCSGWEAMRLAVRRWSESDVEKYITAYSKQMASSAAEQSKCQSACRKSVTLLANTEFETVPLFCELACYHAALGDEPPVSVASMFEAVLKAILLRDIRKQLGPHTITATDLEALIHERHPLLQRRAFESAEEIGWRVVSNDETGWFSLSGDEASRLLPFQVAVDIAPDLTCRVAGPPTAGAHCGWLAPEPAKVRNRYSFLRKPFAEYMAFRRLKRHFGDHLTLPETVTLEPRWHLPLQLLAGDVASTFSTNTWGGSHDGIFRFVEAVHTLLKNAMAAPPAVKGDFFCLYDKDASDGWVPRRLPTFARSGCATCVNQVVSVFMPFTAQSHRVRLASTAV